ncbi:MAG: hypothetical protein U0X91_10890 [Spirosomataceae bacterium]
MSAFQKLTIHFETSAQLPPPYSYRYTLTLTPSGQSLHGNLQLSYTHRDELDLDEIEAEGFSQNDDYQWNGSLEKVWRDELEKLAAQTRLTETPVQEAESDLIYLQIEPGSNESYPEKGQPKNLTDWLYLAQELVQAIYETSEKERPFELHVLDAGTQGVREAVLTASFRSRSAQVKRVISGKSSLRFYPWQELSSLMEILYAADWLTDMASTQKPKKNGLYVNPGDGMWYEWGKQIVEPGKSGKSLAKIKSMVNELLG